MVGLIYGTLPAFHLVLYLGLIPVVSQVRRWDAQMLVNTETHNSTKAVYCVAVSSASAAVVAFGGADRAWRLWDSRQSRKEDMV